MRDEYQRIPPRYRLLAAVIVGLILRATNAGGSPPLVPYTVPIQVGTDAEQAIITKNSGTTVDSGIRRVDLGEFLVYGFTVVPGETALLSLTMADAVDPTQLPAVTVLGSDNKPIEARVGAGANNSVDAAWRVPSRSPLGSRMTVVISAKFAPFALKQIRLVEQQEDANSDGIPDQIAKWLVEGLPVGTRATAVGSPNRPYTVTQTPRAPDPTIDLQTDAMFGYTNDANVISGWKGRGYTVWTMGGSREGKEFADANPNSLQRDKAGQPVSVDGSYYVTPTPEHTALELQRYQQAVLAGSIGVCPEEPEYWARAGYEEAFKQIWKQKLGIAWADPSSSVDARWQASGLMAAMETDHVDGVLHPFTAAANVRRMVAIHSPLHYAEIGIVSPQYGIIGLPSVQDVVGQVWTGTARYPVRYAGIRGDRSFSTAYLEYSSLNQLVRGTGKHLWFLMDPLEDDPNRSEADYKSHYESTVAAALFFPDVDSYEVMPWPERVFGHIGAEYATEVQSIMAALQDMHNQRNVIGAAASDANVGVFVSDSMQWQREDPAPSDLDGLFGLTLPLLERGVPVQAASLNRAAEPGYLRQFKTLLLSYDFQKPLEPATQAALTDWVQRGGALLFFGGSDAYNAITQSWWHKAGLKAPEDDMWRLLGIPVGGAAETRPGPNYQNQAFKIVVKAARPEHALGNRSNYTIDLTSFAQITGSVQIRFADLVPQDGWGAWVASVELRVGGKIAASFAAGSDVENRFLVSDHGSQFDGRARYADGTTTWAYEFDNLPRSTPITLTLDMGNSFEVSAASITPDFGHTLLATDAISSLAKSFPRLRVAAEYPATVYPKLTVRMRPEPTKTVADHGAPTSAGNTGNNGDTNGSSATAALYTLRSGGSPVWMERVGKGLLMNVGVAPGFFSQNERSAGLLRALVQYGLQRAGGNYREPGALILRRGRYTIVRTFNNPEDVEGRTMDLLSPTLSVAEDRTIPSQSIALLCDLGSSDEPPHIGFVSGRIQAKLETALSTGFFVRAAAGTTGVARLNSGGKQLVGARAIDHEGRTVAVQSFVDGGTVLLRYLNDPDGVAVRVGWQ